MLCKHENKCLFLHYKMFTLYHLLLRSRVSILKLPIGWWPKVCVWSEPQGLIPRSSFVLSLKLEGAEWSAVYFSPQMLSGRWIPAMVCFSLKIAAPVVTVSPCPGDPPEPSCGSDARVCDRPPGTKSAPTNTSGSRSVHPAGGKQIGALAHLNSS